MMDKTWSIWFRYWMLSVLILALALFIGYTREAIPPLVVGALIAYVLNPVVEFLSQRTRLRRPAVVTIVFLLGLSAMVVLPIVFIPVLLDEIQILVTDLQDILTQAQEALSRPVVVAGWTFNLGQVLPDISDLFSEGITSIPADALHLLEATTRNLLWGLVIVVTSYYLLKDWARLRDWMLNLSPETYRSDIQHLYEEIKLVWRGYLRGNLALMGVVALLFIPAWLIIGVPGGLILGLIAGVLTIIPDLGPAIAAALAVLVALVEGSTYLPLSNFWFSVLVLGIYLLLINIKNIWIRPHIFGRSVHMHDGLVFIAIVAAVVLQGILGALIVIPVLASMGVIGRYIWQRILGETPFPEVEEMVEAVVEEEEES